MRKEILQFARKKEFKSIINDTVPYSARVSYKSPWWDSAAAAALLDALRAKQDSMPKKYRTAKIDTPADAMNIFGTIRTFPDFRSGKLKVAEARAYFKAQGMSERRFERAIKRLITSGRVKNVVVPQHTRIVPV